MRCLLLLLVAIAVGAIPVIDRDFYLWRFVLVGVIAGSLVGFARLVDRHRSE